jgi:hypothetical protein
MKTSLIICFALLLISGFASPAQANDWPTIRPLHEIHTFDSLANGADTPVLVFIKDATGVPIYKLECHNGNYEDDSGYGFSGAFQCVLFAVHGDKPTSGNLLADAEDQQGTSWWNRGRMRADQLRGKCFAYPEYSTLRHFRLRGMLITFRFSKIEWATTTGEDNNPAIDKFTFSLDAVPDEAAHGSVAEVPKSPKPPDSCYP